MSTKESVIRSAITEQEESCLPSTFLWQQNCCAYHWGRMHTLKFYWEERESSMESDLSLGGRMYRCKNIQYPNHYPKLGFLNLNSRNVDHQSRCPFQHSSSQGILEPLNFQTIQNNCSHPPYPLLNQTQHSINLPHIPRLGLPVDSQQLPSNPMAHQSSTGNGLQHKSHK